MADVTITSFNADGQDVGSVTLQNTTARKASKLFADNIKMMKSLGVDPYTVVEGFHLTEQLTFDMENEK